MPGPGDFDNSSFSGDTHYRIVVKGELDARWSDRLAGLSIERVEGNDQRPCTILTGKIRDQAELSGVLDSLYSLHLPIVRVEQIDQDDLP